MTFSTFSQKVEQKRETGSTMANAKIRPRAARFINQPHVIDIRFWPLAGAVFASLFFVPFAFIQN